jgi:AcrR family transcriptional regulator
VNVKGPRPYRSRLRASQAEGTRVRVLEAAREAFRARGYSGATIEDIAAAAAVAVPTVYAVFGNKRRLLHAILARIGMEHDLGSRINVIILEDQPREQLRLVAVLARELWDASWDLIRIVEWGRGDPELDALWLALDDERNEGERQLVERLAARHSLRDYLTTYEASDLLWALSGPGLYGLLVGVRNWSPERYERWLAHSLTRELLPGAVEVPATSPG